MIVFSQVNIKGNDVTVFRDKHGKWFVQVNSIMTQKRLNAKEIVRWFCNAQHELPMKLDTDELITEAKKIRNAEGAIAAIKFVRTQRQYGLKEAKDFVEKYCM